MSCLTLPLQFFFLCECVTDLRPVSPSGGSRQRGDVNWRQVDKAARAARSAQDRLYDDAAKVIDFSYDSLSVILHVHGV